MIKYIPTPTQLARWRNETTIIIAAIGGLLVSVSEFLGPLASLDPRIKGVAVIVAGLGQRWNAYGKETIEVDLPAMQEEAEIDWEPDPLAAFDWMQESFPAKDKLRDKLRPTRSKVGDV